MGFEARFEWAPLEGVRTTIAYSFMDFVFEDFLVEGSSGVVQLAGNEIPGVPAHRFLMGMVYEHGSGAYAEINFQASDKYFANDGNGPASGAGLPVENFVNDSYLLVDLRVGFRKNFRNMGIDFFFGVNNLLDKRYNGSIVPNAFGARFFEPAADRNWYVGVGLPVFGD